MKTTCYYRSCVLLKSLTLGLGLMGVGQHAHAALNASWINNTGGFYTDISNWTTAAVPTVANDLVFQFPGDYRIDHLDNRAVNRIDIIDQAGITFDLHNAAAGIGVVFSVADDVKVADAALSIGDGLGSKYMLMDLNGDLDITGFANDPTVGALTINNDGRLWMDGNAVLGNGSGRFGWARVSGTNAEWKMNSGALSVGSSIGNGGGGQLVVEDGGRFIGSFIEIGVSALSPDQSDRGEVIVSGVGTDGIASHVDLSGSINVGTYDDSMGQVTVNGGAKLSVSEARIGSYYGGQGIVEVSGTDALGNPSVWETGNFLVNATYTTDGIRFRDGAQIMTDGPASLYRGGVTLSGIAAVGGTPTRWTISDFLRVGDSSSDIHIKDGAQLEAGALDIAIAPSTIGSVRLYDSTPDKVSRLTIAGDALIGGTETTNGGVANLEMGLNTKTHIGGTLKIWNNAFVPLRGELFAKEIDILDAGPGSFPLQSGRLSFEQFHGDLNLENVELSPGEVTAAAVIFGEYDQDETASLRMDINGPVAGSDFDQLSIGGSAQLDGDFLLTLGNGFTPGPADTFTVLGATLITGSFDNAGSGARLTTLDGRGSFIVNYGLGSIYGANQIVLSDFMMEMPADLDGDGDVDGVDLGQFFSNFTGPSGGPAGNPQADLDGDGDVDGVDLGTAFAAFTGPLAPATVPEPATLALLALGGLWMTRRRV